MSSARLDAQEYARGVREGDRRLLAKTITLLESQRAEDVELGQEVLELLAPECGQSVRVGITGPPGVGKSTLIEAFGFALLEQGRRVAVLTVDPSSPVSGGSILGDKTRMIRLAAEPNAYIRPSPSGLTLGGVAHRTREAMLVCEAAGFDAVIVETVGVGQSEAEVESMVDFFAVMLQPGSGDELQGIKKGVLELADVLFVNKADGDGLAAAERTHGEYRSAAHLLRPSAEGWTLAVLLGSAKTGDGIDELWKTITAHQKLMKETGAFDTRRAQQGRAWFRRLLDDGLMAAFQTDPAIVKLLNELESDLDLRKTTPPHAARRLLDRFLRR